MNYLYYATHVIFFYIDRKHAKMIDTIIYVWEAFMIVKKKNENAQVFMLYTYIEYCASK